jgi:hypothetical protein
VVLVYQLLEALEVAEGLVTYHHPTLEQIRQVLLVVQAHLDKVTPVELEVLPVEQQYSLKMEQVLVAQLAEEQVAEGLV